MLNTPAVKTLISDLFALDIANPWFGQTVEVTDDDELAQDYSPDQPRDPKGVPTGGQFTSKRQTEPEYTHYPVDDDDDYKEQEPKKKKGYKPKPEDFAKAKIVLGEGGVDAIAEEWGKNMEGIEPAEFKRDFLGGVNATMTISRYSPESWYITGNILGADDNSVGTYTRTINFSSKSAVSSYFQLYRTAQHSDIGKRVLAGNVDIYKKLGITKVSVHANIDVGGYAWAKYGYVPSQSSWQELSERLGRRSSPARGLSRSERGLGRGGYTPESWDEITEDDQYDIRDRWMRETSSEFQDSEIENWRESGQPLEDAKRELANNFSRSSKDWPEWAVDAIDDNFEDEDFPYTTPQILAAISIDEYSSRYEEGKDDPDFTFDDDKLREPSDAPPKEQMMLPGFKPEDLSKHLTEDMRDRITTALTKAFNDAAEKIAEDADPPDFSDSVSEMQEDHWDNMSERERYRQAERNGLLPEYDNPDDDSDSNDDDAQTEPVEATNDVQKLLDSKNPRAIWQLSDAPGGKELLLGSDWNGTLDLNDKASMDRFNAYVSKVKKDKPSGEPAQAG